MAFVKAGLWGPQAIIDSTGHPQAGATATVYLTDGVTLASLWTSAAKSVVMSNPTQADVHGNLHFWTDPGPYMLKMLIGTVVTWLDVEVPIDPGEAAQDSDVTAAIATAEAYADGIVAAALAAALAGSQPLDADLTAIAALSTTAYGRAFLALADAAAGRTALGLGTAATHAVGDFDAAGAATAAAAALVNSAPGTLDTLNELATALADDPAFATTMTNALAGKQPLDSDLTAIAALSTTAFGRSALALADSAALRVLAGTVIGTDVQAHDADLDAIAALSTTAFGRALLVLADAAALRAAAGLGTAATAATTDFDAAGTASAAITALVNGAPGALDTLNELATALGDDAAFATTVTNALATKLIAGATSGTANQAALPAAVAHTHEIVKTDDGGVYVSTGSSWVQLVPPAGTYAPASGIAESAVTNLVTDLAAKQPILSPTAVKIANYTAAAGDLVLCDTSGGIFTVTLPTAPADKTSIAVDLITSGNTLTIARGGADVFQKAAGPTSLTMNTANRVLVLQYQTATAVWHVQDHLPAVISVKGDLLTYSTERARLGVGTDGQVLTADSTQTLGIKWATASGGGIPVGTIDLSASPYSVIANDVTKAAANTVAIAQALTDRAVTGGVKELVWPVGTTYVSNPVDPGGGNSSGAPTAYRFDASGHDLIMRGAIGGYQSKIAFASDWITAGVGGFGLMQVMFKAGAADNVYWKDLEFVGPQTMPTPFPCFQRIDNYYSMGVWLRDNSTAMLHLERVKTSGLWGNPFQNRNSFSGKVRLIDCDLFGIDVTMSVFTDDTGTQRKPGNRLEMSNCDIRSHLFMAKSFITAATVTDSSTKVDIVTDRAHNLIVGDTIRLPCMTTNTAGWPTPFTGIAGMTGVTNSQYTVTDIITTTEFKIGATGVSGSGTAGLVVKTTSMEFAISQVVVAGTTLTITTTAAMDLVATSGGGGEFVYFPDGLPGVTGFPVADPNYQVSYQVQSVVDTHNFTITKSGVTAGTYTPTANVAMMWKDNGIGLYTGVDLDVQCTNSRFWDGNRVNFKSYSSSATRIIVEPLQSFVGCEFHGFHQYASIDTCNTGASRTVIADCLFAGTGNAVNFMGQAGSTVISDNNEFYQGKSAIYLGLANAGGSEFIISGGHARTPANPTFYGVGGSHFNFDDAGHHAQTIVMDGVIMEGNNNGEFVQLPDVTTNIATLTNLVLIGGANRTNSASIKHGGELRMIGCRLTDHHSLALQNTTNATKVDLDGNDFAMTSGTPISGTNVPAGKFRGRSNHWPTVTPSWSTSATGPLLECPQGQNPTAATSAANTTLSTDYNIHHMTAVAVTVNNLWIGGSANANRCFGGTRLTLIFDGAATVLSNSGGNIRLKGGADVTPAIGETRNFIFDVTNDLWREV